MTHILTIDLSVLKAEAERIQRDDPDTPLEAAYGFALQSLAMLQAEGHAVSPFEARLLAELDAMYRNQGGRPVSTVALATRLGIDNRFTMLYYLRNLERRGLVHRPLGRQSKSGWGVAA